MARIPALTPIESSLFDAYRYDPATSKLTVKFKNGATYVYADVPAEKAEAFAGSASPGAYYAANIRDNFVSSKMG